MSFTFMEFPRPPSRTVFCVEDDLGRVADFCLGAKVTLLGAEPEGLRA